MKTIPLTRGQFALVDDEDFERVSKLKWYALKCIRDGQVCWYGARTRPGHRTMLLHRFVMDAPSGVKVDHKDGNGLDCRRHNLRLCTNAQNSANSSKKKGTSSYKGVYLDKDGPAKNRWVASIMANNTYTWLGRHETEEEAARAYDSAARAKFGEFACVNFPQDGESCAMRRATR
jgi:hypothetical protein